jgi:MFS family permease
VNYSVVDRFCILRHFFYLIFNIAGGLSGTIHQLLGFRLLSGIGASATLAVSSPTEVLPDANLFCFYQVGASTVAELFPSSERGTAVAIISMGPIVGGFVAQYTT